MTGTLQDTLVNSTVGGDDSDKAANINALDLSGWRVCKISTRPTGFDTNGVVIEPNWGMSC
jgi:hypothetical protein